MKNYNHIMPKYMINTKGIFEFLNNLYSTFNKKSYANIFLDCENTKFISPALMAPLGLILTKIKSQQNKVYFRNLTKLNKSNLLLCNLLKNNTDEELEVYYTYNHVIKYKTFSSSNYEQFKISIMDDFQNINDQIKIETLISLLYELFENVKMHGGNKNNKFKNKEIFISGFHDIEFNKLSFTIANNGNSIKETISKTLGIDYNFDYEYIKWALIRSNTTRDRSTPGGLGLFLLNELIKKSYGKLYIISGKGYGEITYEYENYHEFPSPFPGTIISFEIDLSKLVNITEFDFYRKKFYLINNMFIMEEK